MQILGAPQVPQRIWPRKSPFLGPSWPDLSSKSIGDS